MTEKSAPGRTATIGLLLGLLVTLLAVVCYSLYITGQITGLRVLQSELSDRSRKDSLQLLRIQNDLHSLGLAMRDMLDGDQPYGLTAWATQFERIRLDLEDALGREAEVAVASRTSDQQRYLGNSFSQFWSAADQIFALARAGQEDDAPAQIRLSLQARQAPQRRSAAARGNNASEEQTATRVQEIYGQVQRQVYLFLPHACRHRADERVSDSLELLAVAERRRCRSSATELARAHRHARVTLRHVPASSMTIRQIHGDGIDARPRPEAAARALPLAPSSGKSARSHRTR